MLPNRVDVFGTGLTLLGRSDVSQAVTGLFRLQICAVLGLCRIKLPEDICTSLTLKGKGCLCSIL